MKDVIVKFLKDLEKKENIKILYCVEWGSRAWGFASPDSDYDIRFIYIRPYEYYLSFDKKRDVIEVEIDDMHDVCGWDISKALPLLYKSNTNIFEWLASPIIYYEAEEFKMVRDICDKYFSVKESLYNYLNIAKRNAREYLSDTNVKIKKYFCIIRPLLCCEWIMEYGTKPPFVFSTLYERYTKGEIRESIENLIELKVKSGGIVYGNHDLVIDEYINNEISRVEAFLEGYKKTSFLSIDEIDSVFVNLLKKLWKF